MQPCTLCINLKNNMQPCTLCINKNNLQQCMMMCKISTVVRRELSLIEDLKQRTTMTTVEEHRWGAGQSSSDAFVRDFVENNQQVSM